jgi:hypothetical protein
MLPLAGRSRHILHQGQRELLGRVGRRARPPVLQPGEAVALESTPAFIHSRMRKVRASKKTTVM